MGKEKLDILKHRDFEELLTITFEFLKQNFLQYAKFAFLSAIPFIILSAIFGFDLLINQQLNIFELFNKLKLETAAVNTFQGLANLLVIILYLITVSIVGALSYVYLKLYKDGTSRKEIKFKNLWENGKGLVIWLLLFNGLVFLLLATYMYFLGFLNIFVTVSLTLFVWGFTLVLMSFGFILSSNLISWGSVYILIFVFVLVPVFIFSIWLFIRCSLLILYSIPLKLEEPKLNFSKRLLKCYQLLEGEALKSWMYIHVISLALFFIGYVFCMPVYGLLTRVGLFEEAVSDSILAIFFKSFSYGFVVLLSAFMHLAISLSFYSLFAKAVESQKIKSHLTTGPLGYKINENGA